MSSHQAPVDFEIERIHKCSLGIENIDELAFFIIFGRSQNPEPVLKEEETTNIVQKIRPGRAVHLSIDSDSATLQFSGGLILLYLREKQRAIDRASRSKALTRYSLVCETIIRLLKGTDIIFSIETMPLPVPLLMANTLMGKVAISPNNCPSRSTVINFWGLSTMSIFPPVFGNPDLMK